MPVKSSGQLSLRYDILAEVGGASYVNLSLRNMSSRAGFATPDAMSEFYGYSNAPTIFPLAEIGYDSVNRDRACINAASGLVLRVFGDGPALQDCSVLYSRATGDRYAAAGWYAENFTQYERYWNGNAFTQEAFCRI